MCFSVFYKFIFSQLFELTISLRTSIQNLAVSYTSSKVLQEYKYRPPLKYLFVGIVGLAMSTLFGMVIGAYEIGYSIIMGIFCLMTLGMGIAFLAIFIGKFNVGNLKLGTHFIEIPGRWKKTVRLDFNDIVDIVEFDTYDNVIEIQSNKGVYLIERNWMKQKEFDTVKIKLKEYYLSK